MKSITLYILALLSTTAFISCATINNVFKKNSSPQRQVVSATSPNEANNVNKNPQVNSPVKTMVTEADSLNRLINGQWFFDRVENINISGDEERPFLYFESNSHRFYAYNGCNYINGSYTLSGNSNITLDNVLSTMALCPDIEWADLIAYMWGNITHIMYRTQGGEEYLELKNVKNHTLALLKRHPMTALNGLWEATELNGSKVTGEYPTLVIDLIEKTVHGNTVCNIFNGEIFQNPDVPMSIQFQGMAVTRMSCPEVATETAFLVGMELTEKAIILDNDNAILTDNAGTHLIKLKRKSAGL